MLWPCAGSAAEGHLPKGSRAYLSLFRTLSKGGEDEPRRLDRQRATRLTPFRERGVSEMAMHLLSIAPLRLFSGRWLRLGCPTSPREVGLRLLPSGPDRVRRSPPRGTLPSTPRIAASPEAPDLEEEFNPAKAGCGFRAPPAPHLAWPSPSVGFQPSGVKSSGPSAGIVLLTGCIPAARSQVAVPRLPCPDSPKAGVELSR